MRTPIGFPAAFPLLLAALLAGLFGLSSTPQWVRAATGGPNAPESQAVTTPTPQPAPLRNQPQLDPQPPTPVIIPIDPPGPTPTPAPGGGGGPGDIIKTIINNILHTIHFPAKQIKEAIVNAALSILTGELGKIKPALVYVADAGGLFPQSNTITDLDMRAAGAEQGGLNFRLIFGMPGGMQPFETVMTQAAVPLWALSLALLGLAIVTRNAAAVGFSIGDGAYEFVRWLLICLASGNGIAIAYLVHGLFLILSQAILAEGTYSSSQLIDRLVPGTLITGAMFTGQLILIILVIIIAICVLGIMLISLLARYVLTVGLAMLAPLAIATEGIPFTRFIFRDWLNSFLRIEMLNVLNAFVIAIFSRLILPSTVFDASPGLLNGIVKYILNVVVAVGLISVITAMNFSVYRYVFGTIADMWGQIRSAAIGTVTALASLATGGATGAMGGLAGAASALGNATGLQDFKSIGAGLQAGNALSEWSWQQRLPSNSASSNNSGAPNPSNNPDSGGRGGPLVPVGSRGERLTPRQAVAQEQQRQIAQSKDAARENDRRLQSLARDSGAKSLSEQQSVMDAAMQGEAHYGRSAWNRAMGQAATDARAMASKYPGTPTELARAMGVGNWGQLVGALAEEQMLGQEKAIPPASGPLFTVPPTASHLERGGLPGYRPAESKSTTAHNADSPSSRANAIQATGAVTESDRDSVNTAMDRLSLAYPNANVAGAVGQIGPVTQALSDMAGGTQRAANALGYSDFGEMVGSLAQTRLRQTDQIAPGERSTFRDPPTLSDVAAKIPQLGGIGSNNSDFGAAVIQRLQTVNALGQVMGAQTADERASVGNALAALSTLYGSSEATQAMTDVAPTMRALAHGAGGGTQLAAALNRPDFGSIGGSFAEQALVATGRTAQQGQPIYAPTPTLAELRTVGGFSGLSETNANISGQAAQAQALGAVQPQEQQDVAAAITNLSRVYSPPALQRAIGEMSPVFNRLANEGGGLQSYVQRLNGTGAFEGGAEQFVGAALQQRMEANGETPSAGRPYAAAPAVANLGPPVAPQVNQRTDQIRALGLGEATQPTLANALPMAMPAQPTALPTQAIAQERSAQVAALGAQTRSERRAIQEALGNLEQVYSPASVHQAVTGIAPAFSTAMSERSGLQAYVAQMREAGYGGDAQQFVGSVLQHRLGQMGETPTGAAPYGNPPNASMLGGSAAWESVSSSPATSNTHANGTPLISGWQAAGDVIGSLERAYGQQPVAAAINTSGHDIQALMSSAGGAENFGARLSQAGYQGTVGQFLGSHLQHQLQQGGATPVAGAQPPFSSTPDAGLIAAAFPWATGVDATEPGAIGERAAQLSGMGVSQPAGWQAANAAIGSVAQAYSPEAVAKAMPGVSAELGAFVQGAGGLEPLMARFNEAGYAGGFEQVLGGMLAREVERTGGELLPNASRPYAMPLTQDQLSAAAPWTEGASNPITRAQQIHSLLGNEGNASDYWSDVGQAIGTAEKTHASDAVANVIRDVSGDVSGLINKAGGIAPFEQALRATGFSGGIGEYVAGRIGQHLQGDAPDEGASIAIPSGGQILGALIEPSESPTLPASNATAPSNSETTPQPYAGGPLTEYYRQQGSPGPRAAHPFFLTAPTSRSSPQERELWALSVGRQIRLSLGVKPELNASRYAGVVGRLMESEAGLDLVAQAVNEAVRIGGESRDPQVNYARFDGFLERMAVKHKLNLSNREPRAEGRDTRRGSQP